MTFQEAKEELLTLAKDEYCSLQYELTISDRAICKGKEFATCKVYLNGRRFHTGTTWREALDSLKRELNPQPQIAEVNEMPTEELTTAKAA